jgi:hypothetical protein
MFVSVRQETPAMPPSPARTFDGKLEAAGGRPAGFDYMRLVLSLSVIAMHAPVVSYGLGFDAQIWSSYAQGPIRLVLGIFFALSGFLVAGSLERSRTLGYFPRAPGHQDFPRAGGRSPAVGLHPRDDDDGAAAARLLR